MAVSFLLAIVPLVAISIAGLSLFIPVSVSSFRSLVVLRQIDTLNPPFR